MIEQVVSIYNILCITKRFVITMFFPMKNIHVSLALKYLERSTLPVCFIHLGTFFFLERQNSFLQLPRRFNRKGTFLVHVLG